MVDEGVKITTIPLVAMFCFPFGVLPYCNFTTRPGITYKYAGDSCKEGEDLLRMS
jgi:hypothetical protein